MQLLQHRDSRYPSRFPFTRSSGLTNSGQKRNVSQDMPKTKHRNGASCRSLTGKLSVMSWEGFSLNSIHEPLSLGFRFPSHRLLWSGREWRDPTTQALNRTIRRKLTVQRNQRLSPRVGGGWSEKSRCLLYLINSWIQRQDHTFILQFSSVAQSCLTLCYPMNRSTPGLPVHPQLPEFTQTHVHWGNDAIQPSHPLSFPSPAPIPSQHQGLF